jgi:D-inositol-3-phosphate glycosyltransferase
LGLAVIAKNTTGFLALVEEGVTGYLVAPRDPEALAARIRTLINNPERSRKMGSAGLARARRLFSIEAITAQYVQCYRDIATKKRGIR